jgi:hypothetical protein
VNGVGDASLYGEALTKACAAKDLTREGVDKAPLTITAFGKEFGMSHRTRRRRPPGRA